MDTDWEGVEQGCAPAESHAETEDSEPPLVRHDRPKIDVEFVSLGLRLKGSKVQILHVRPNNALYVLLLICCSVQHMRE